MDKTAARWGAAPDGHIPTLDGLRGVAIFLVLCFHLWNFSNPTSLLGRAWQVLAVGGWCGVDLFFVLSGFLITSILYDAKGTPGFFRNFYMRRVLRIFPLYYGVLAVTFLLLPRFVTPAGGYADLCRHQAWLWTYLPNWYLVKHPGDYWLPCGFNPFWSLAIEEQFYLVWPLLVFCAGRKALVRFAVLAVLVSLFVRLALTYYGFKYQAAYVLTLARLDGFAAGAAVALVQRGEAGTLRLVRWAWPVLVGSCVALAGMAIQERGLLRWHDRPVQAIGYTLLALLFAAVLALVVTGQMGQTVLRLWPLRTLGKYSYGLYVLHTLIGHGVSITRHELGQGLAWLFGTNAADAVMCSAFREPVLITALTLLGAFLSWHLYEKHFLELKRFFPRTTAESASASTSLPSRLAA